MGRELIHFAKCFNQEDIPTIVAGGYGLVLKNRWLRDTDERTIYSNLPPARSTADIDLFLTIEVISDAEKAQYIREELNRRGYEPVQGAENYQFIRELTAGRSLKIDLLTPEPQNDEDDIRIKAQRVRPEGASNTIHGRKVPEAISLEENVRELQIIGQNDKATVYLPDPFTYYLLKLFALRDRRNEPLLARHHAFDMYLNLGMMTEDEWDQARQIFDTYQETRIVTEAKELTERFFGDLEAEGILRLREYDRDRSDLDISEKRLDQFIDLLRDLFQINQ
jgi:hypothetical protein